MVIRWHYKFQAFPWTTTLSTLLVVFYVTLVLFRVPVYYKETSINLIANKQSMKPNSDNLLILRAQTKITETEKMLKWVVRHIDDVATLDLAHSEFSSLIYNAIQNLNTIRSIILRHEEPINLQVEAIKLYNHIHSAKGYLERVKMEEDPERYWQRRCGSLEEMLSGVSQKLNQSKREGAIFDHSDERLKPLKAR